MKTFWLVALLVPTVLYSATTAPARARRGPADAPVTITIFSDFECPYCAEGAKIMDQLQLTYGKQIAIVFKHHPLPNHRSAMAAAKRFEAIALQSPKKAFAFHDLIFKERDRLVNEGESYLDLAAANVGVNMARMKKDMESPDVLRTIQEDIAEAKSKGLPGTPSFLVNSEAIRGAAPIQYFDQAVQKALKCSASGKKDCA